MHRAEIHVCLVGFGLAGRAFHAPIIASVPGLKLCAVVDRRTDDAPRLYPGTRVLRSMEEALADPTLDLMVLATPNDTHAPLARSALLAGKHVLVDKPLALASAEVAELEALARQNGLFLGVYHNRRFDGDFLTLKRLLKEDALGQPLRFESRFDRLRPVPRAGAWREGPGTGSGILYDLGPHLIDQALALFGPPLRVWASVRTERQGALAPDAFDLALAYPNAQVFLGAGMMVREPRPRFVLCGIKATYVKYGMDPQEARLRAGERPGRLNQLNQLNQPKEPAWGTEAPEAYGTLYYETEGQPQSRRIPTEAGDYRRYYAALALHLSSRGSAPTAFAPTAPAPEGSDTGRQVARIIELALASSASGSAQPYSPE